MTDIFRPSRFVITGHPRVTDAVSQAAQISQYLERKSFDAPYGSIYDEALRQRVKNGEFDIMVAIGGDGTMLRAAHLCAPRNVPVMGINQGRLGFLFQVESQEWQSMIDALLDGQGWIENRMTLRASHFRTGEPLGSWHALNDAVIARGQSVRPVHLTASVDGLLLANYVADGLIAATPTGSTAYALAAGGPILPPELRNMLLIPIAPHLSVDRAVVLSEGSSVRIAIRGDNTVLSVDGQPAIGLMDEDIVEICAGDYSVQFVRFGDRGYFYRNLTAHMNQNPSTGIHK